MITYQWAVIDPAFDRPFFSSSPPPATLLMKAGMQVIQYAIEVPDPPMVTVAMSAEDIRHVHRDAYSRFAKACQISKESR